MINESDIIFDTTIMNDNMVNELKNNEEQGSPNHDQLIDEEDNLELINDSWINVAENIVAPAKVNHRNF